MAQNIPRTRGKTHLAYITDAEEALLRARDKKKGVKRKEFSPEGIPVLQDRGGEDRGDQSVIDAQEAENIRQRDARQAKLDAGWTREWEAGGDEWLVPPKTKVTTTPTTTTPTTTTPTTTTPTTTTPTTTTPTTPTPTTTTPTTTTPTTTTPTTPTTTTTPTTPTVTQGTVEDVAAPVVEAAKTVPFEMATLTNDMDLSNKLQEIISTNSPLFKAAQTKAMQNMQRRGLVNSTLAQEAVMNAVINVALPIAKAEVDQLVANLYFNTDWTNKQKTQANQAAYNKMLTQLQGSLNFTLQQLTGSQNIGIQNLRGQQQMDVQTLQGSQAVDLQTLRGSQAVDLQTLIGEQETAIQQQKTKATLWAKYGDWITTMATTEGADQEAWQNMLNMLKGSGGWPKTT